QIDRVQLAAHRLRALLLPRHDEGAADVAILDESLAILHAQQLRDLHRARTARVRDRNDHVDAVLGPLALDLLRKALAHAQARLVHRNIVDDGVGPREIDIFEDAWRVARHGHA